MRALKIGAKERLARDHPWLSLLLARVTGDKEWRNAALYRIGWLSPWRTLFGRLMFALGVLLVVVLVVVR